MKSPALHRARRVALWALVIFVVLELVARRYVAGPLDLLRPSRDPALVFELKPGRYTSDGYLLRMGEVTYDIAPDGCRHMGEGQGRPAIVFLGSSLAFGLGVPHERTFSHLAWSSLRASSGGAVGPALNCAVPGHNLLQGVRGAALAVERVRPRLVALLLQSSHLRSVYDWSRLTPRNALLRWSTRHVRLARLAYLLSLRFSTDDFRTPYESPERLTRALDGLAAALRANDARAVFLLLGEVHHPTLNLVQELDARGLAWRRVEPLASGHYLDGDHWNERGHAIIAARVQGALADVLSLAP